MSQLTHYFIFDPETQALTSHFSDVPLPAYGPFAIICISPLTYRSESGRRVMNWLAEHTLECLDVRERVSFDGSMSMAERSQFVVWYLNKGYQGAMNNIAALEASLKPRAMGLAEWDSLYDRTIKAAGLQDDSTVSDGYVGDLMRKADIALEWINYKNRAEALVDNEQAVCVEGRRYRADIVEALILDLTSLHSHICELNSDRARNSLSVLPYSVVEFLKADYYVVVKKGWAALVRPE